MGMPVITKSLHQQKTIVISPEHNISFLIRFFHEVTTVCFTLCGMWCCVTGQGVPDVAKDSGAFVFRIE